MSKALATKNVAAVLLGLAMVFGFAFSFATPAKADVLSDLQAQVQALLAQIAALQGGSTTTTGGACFTFTQNLKQGQSGAEAMQVQKFLNSKGFTVAATGAGSPGNETSYFGPATKAAVIKFQNANAATVLTPVGLTAGTGYWGPSSRAAANAMCTGGTTGGTTPPPVVAGTSLTVAAGTQPANSLAPKNASQVPFTTFVLSNYSSGPVTVSSVTVQRTGLANDAAFSGVILVENGMRIGSTKTFNSNHQANLDASVTLQPGQSRTFTVSGDMAADETSYAGQVATISVVGINTTAAVSGSLPIVGASHTINNSLTVGTLTMRQGPSDPDSTSLSQPIGTTNYVAAAVNMTAGSAENIWVKSIRWNQSGSASSGDLANVRTVIDGTEYPATIDPTGKYYTSVFPGNGLKIEKGNTKEAIVKFDLISGGNRNANFDIYKANDTYAVGEIYGYGVTPDADANTASATTDASEFITSDGTASGTSGTPFFSGSQIDITAGTVNSISRANEVAAQNVAENVASQPLGGFVVDIKGEGVTVQQQVYHFLLTGGNGQANDLTSITLVDENGLVVAGPVDGATAAAYGTATFTDTVTFPTGRHVYTLKGKLGTDFANNDTVQASTTPSTDWTNVKGASTGDTVSLSTLSSAVSGNVMTLRAAAVAVSVAATPAAQNVVSGLTGFTVANVQYDATQSGEDIKFTSSQFQYTDAMTTDITNCAAYDGATRLNDTAINPSGTGADTYSFNTNLVVAKGTVKTIAIKCDISGSSTANDTFAMGVADGDTITGTGVGSGTSVAATVTTGANTMTIKGAGTLTVALDASSPAYAIAQAGTTGVTLGVLRFNGTNEDMRLDRVALQLAGGAATTSSASSSPANIAQVTLWDGATQVGTAVFAGSNRVSTTTLSSTVIVPKDGYKTLTVKGDLAGIGVGQATSTSGILLNVDYDDNDSTGTRAIGVSSGSTINRTASADTAVSGVRVFRTIPTFAKLAVPSTTLINAPMDLYRFSITAGSGQDLSLYQLVANISTSTASTANGTTTVTSLKVFAYTDSSFSNAVSGFTDGQVVTTITDLLGSGGDNELQMSSILTIPAGQTRYFRITGTITGTSGTTNWSGSVSTYIAGDSAYPAIAQAQLMENASAVDDDSNDDFVWSPNSTSTSPSFNNMDWANGYGVPGLSSSGSDVITLSR